MPKNIFQIQRFLYVIRKKDIQFLKNFGFRLKELRKQKGISQAQLAFEAEIEISQISRIELGKINTTIETVNLISKILEIPLSEFFVFDTLPK
jgi:transcriptional regulator with XRE-family HTH domain